MTAAGSVNPHPNPRVGALVLNPGGDVVGAGIHRGPGRPHAEVEALREAGEGARGGTLIVTLEPCNHHGRTPPCVDAILAAGIEHAVIGATDPDRTVAGGGAERLEEAGVRVTGGVLESEVEALDPGYFHHRRTGRPRVTLKAALTLDGQVAATDGSSQWITSPDAREDGHRLRSEADAIMVGAGTALADNPQLTVRLANFDRSQPIPVVVAGDRSLPADLRLFERDAIVFSPEPVELPAEVVVLESGGSVDLEKAMVTMGEQGIVDLLVEGGPTLAGALLAAGLVDRCVFYFGAKVAGGAGRPVFDGAFATLADARGVAVTDARKIGPDVRVEFTFAPKEAA